MRILIGAVAIVSLAFATNSEAIAKGKKQQPDAQKTEDQAKKKADDLAYKSALKRIPVSNEKVDPWKSVR
jgi:hypothetical protein